MMSPVVCPFVEVVWASPSEEVKDNKATKLTTDTVKTEERMVCDSSTNELRKGERARPNNTRSKPKKTPSHFSDNFQLGEEPSNRLRRFESIIGLHTEKEQAGRSLLLCY